MESAMNKTREAKVTKVGKVDRRVKRTQRQLKKCLLELLQTKKTEDITVSELAGRADINRGTFYLHYKDVFDMLEKIENETLDNFTSVLNKYTPQELDANPNLIFIDIFNFVEDNYSFCKVLLGENGDKNFIYKLTQSIKQKALIDWVKLYSTDNEEKLNYFCSYIISGCVGVVRQWTIDGMKTPPEEMSQLLADMVLRGVAVLSTDKK